MVHKFLFCFLITFSWISFAADASYGIFMVVKGDVKIQSQQNSLASAKIGGKILSGETIKTGPDSRAKIVMSDKNVINVSPDSVLKIEKYENDAASGKKNVALNLEQGKVRANVEQKYDGDKSKFTIKTPTAVAGVRGTQFMTSFNPSTKMTEIVTFKGAVTLSSLNAQGVATGPAVVVKKGETTTAAPGAPPEPPKVMPKEELKKVESESTASNLKKESDVKQAEQKSPEKKSNDQKSADQKSAEQKPQATAGANGSQKTPAGEMPAAPPPMKMVDQKDLMAAPDFRMPASVDTGIASGTQPLPPPPMLPPAAMLPPPPNPLLNTIISNKMQNMILSVTPKPQ